MQDGTTAMNPEPDSETPGSVEPAAPAPLEALTAERDQLAAEKAGLHDRLLRKQAEFENLRRRADREKAELSEYAAMESVRAILPILDDFERAVKVESADTEYAKGMGLIYQRLLDALKKLGLEPIAAAGQKFNPYIHHAVDRSPADEVEEDTVLEEYQSGYNFKGRLLRPAMVKVAVKQ